MDFLEMLGMNERPEILIIDVSDVPEAYHKVNECIYQYGRNFFIEYGEKMRKKDEYIQPTKFIMVCIRIKNPTNRPLQHNGLDPNSPSRFEYEYPYLDLMSAKGTRKDIYTYGDRIRGRKIYYWMEANGKLHKINNEDEIERINKLQEEGNIPSDAVFLEEPDQFQWAVDLLKEHPLTRQCIITIGRPDDVEEKHIPCLRMIQFMVYEGKLNMIVFFRSWDAYGGVNLNLAGLTVMLEEVSRQTNIPVGELIAFTSNVHHYKEQDKIIENWIKSRFDKRLRIDEIKKE